MDDLIFYVKDNNGDLVPAKFLTYNNSYVADPNSLKSASTPIFDLSTGNQIPDANPNGYLIVPASYNVENAVAFGQTVGMFLSIPGIGASLASAMMVAAYVPNGSQDYQRSYPESTGVNPGDFVGAFTDVASWSLGLVSAVAGFGAQGATTGGGLLNQILNVVNPNIDTSGAGGNNPLNAASINAGAAFATQTLGISGYVNWIGPTLGTATIDDGTNGSLSYNDPSSAADALAADIYPIPSASTASSDGTQLPPDPDAGARSALSNALSQQLGNLSGTFQISQTANGTVVVTGSNGVVISLNSDLSGSKTVATDSSGSYVKSDFDDNGNIQSTLTQTVTSSSDVSGNVTKSAQDVVSDGAGNLISSTSETQQFNASGALISDTTLNNDGSRSYLTFNSDGSSTETFYNAGGQETASSQFNVDGSQTDSAYNTDGSQTVSTLNSAGQETESQQLQPNGTSIDSFYDATTGASEGVVSYGTGDDTTVQFNGGSIELDTSPQEISQTPSGALNIAVGPSGNAQVALSNGDTTGSPIAFSGVESMTLNLDGSYSIVDQSGNAYTLQSVSGSSNYLLSNSSGTLDLTLDASSVASINLGQSVSLQTLAGGTVTVPVFGGSGTLALSNLGDETVDQGSSVTIGANTIDVSSPGSGTTAEYSFAPGGTVSSVSTFDDSSAQGVPTMVSSYNVDGAVTQILTNNSDGSSQVMLFNAADPSAGYITQTQNYSGSNGTGSLLNQTTDFTNGLSEIDSFDPSSTATLTSTVYSSEDGTGVALSQTTDFTDGTSDVTTYSASDVDLSSGGVTAITVQYSGADGTGTVENTTYTLATGVTTTEAQIGSELGSALGKFLGGNNVIENVGISTGLGILGEEVGKAIGVLGAGADISETVASLANSLLPDVATAGAGAVGSYLTGELINDLGISGLPAQILDTGAGWAISTIASNLTEEALGDTSVAWDSGLTLDGFDADFAGFAGTELTSLVAGWDTPQEEEDASIGATIGSIAGSYFGPLGSFIGSIVGDILGGLQGQLSGNVVKYVGTDGQITFNANYSSPYQSQIIYSDSVAPGLNQYVTAIDNAIVSELNAIAADIGGGNYIVDAIPPGQLGAVIDAEYGSDGSSNLEARTVSGVLANFSIDDSSDLISWVVLSNLSEISFSGGDVYVERAIAATVAEWSQPGSSVDLNTLLGNIQIAKDYETYLNNTTAINSLIESSPTSNFAAGWIIELQQANALGITNGSGPIANPTPSDILDLHGTRLYNLNATSIAYNLGRASEYAEYSSDPTVSLSGDDLSFNIQQSGLGMTSNGAHNAIQVIGNSNALTFNGGYDVISETGDQNSITANGDSDSLSASGNGNNLVVNGQYATVTMSGQNDTLTNGNGTVYLADSSSATINGVSDNISLWNSSTLVVNGGSMQLDVAGDTNTVTANGNQAQIEMDGDNNTIYANGQGDQINVAGTGETLQIGSGSVSLINGVAVTVGGEDVGISVSGQDQLVVNGQNIGVTLGGNGDNIIVNGVATGITGDTDSSSMTLNGSGDSISINGDNNILTGNGTGDYLTVSGNDNNLVANGQQFTATLSGASNTATIANGSVVLQNSSTATVNGVSDSVSIYNTTQVVLNGGSMNFSANGGEDTITLNGNDEGVSVQGASNVLTDNGNDNTVTANGDSNNITENGSGEWVTVNGSYDAVQGQMDGTTVTINGTGGAITATGNNNLLIENGANDYLTVNGDSNSLTANGQQITASLTGTGNTVSIGNGTVSLSDNAGGTIDGVADQVNVRNTSQLTVNGGSMSLAVNGSQNTITANGNGNSFSDEASSNLITGNGSNDSFSANGSYNDVTLNGNNETSYINGTDNVLAVNGQGNQVTFAGANNTLHASGAEAFVLDNSSADFEGGGDNLTVYNGDTVTVNGSGFSITETATNSTVVANGDYNVSTIGGNNNAITLNGNSGQVEMSGSLNSVTVSGQSAILSVSGVQQSLAVNQGNITVAAGSQASLTGNGNMVALGASDTWTENGSNNWVNVASDDSVTMMGDGNGVGGDATGVTAILEGNGQYAILSDDAITVGAGVQISVTGNGNTVTAGAGATLDVTGNGNSLQMTGGTLVLPDSESAAGSDPETGNSESGFAINGFDYSSYNAGEFSSAAGAQSMQALAATGANSVSLVVTQYVQNVSDINIEPTSATESDASVEQAIAEAQAQGISVTLDPHLDIADGTWRAYLDPSNVAQFFANYQAMIVHYAEIAQATGVGMLVIGTEMESLSGSAYESYWDNLIAAVRQVYSGKLTYASGWDETANVSFWNKLDVIGADAYVPVTSETDPTLQQLEAGWTTVSSNSYAASVMNNMSPLAFYESMSAEYDKPLLFTEIGYQSVNDTNQLEGAFGTSNWVDFQQQSQALQAFFSIFSQNGGNWFDGAYLWNWEANPAGVEANDFSPQGKAALNIVDYWYGLESGSQSGASTPNTLTGDSNTVTVGDGDALDIVGDDNDVTLGANGAVNVDGQGNTVQVTGGNNLIQTSDATTITLTGTSTTAMVVGDGNDVTASGAQDGLAVNGNNSTVTLAGDTDALTVSGEGSTINVQGNGDTVSVTGTGNVIDVTGNDAVIQTSGATTVVVGSTADSTSVAGDGDTIQINGTASSVSVTGSGANIVVGDGGTTLTLDSGSYQVSAGNGNNSITAGDGSDVISVGSGTNTIVLGNGADTVTLGDGTNTLTLGSGADAITLGNGNATIALGGDDTIAINVAAGDSTNAVGALITDANTSSGQSNELTFGSADSDQLWFSRSNNDLLISVIGTSSEIDVSNWYSNSSALESITAADGKVLTGDDVNALVNAMAAFSPPAAGSTTLPESYQSQLEPVIAANWH